MKSFPGKTKETNFCKKIWGTFHRELTSKLKKQLFFSEFFVTDVCCSVFYKCSSYLSQLPSIKSWITSSVCACFCGQLLQVTIWPAISEFQQLELCLIDQYHIFHYEIVRKITSSDFKSIQDSQPSWTWMESLKNGM